MVHNIINSKADYLFYAGLYSYQILELYDMNKVIQECPRLLTAVTNTAKVNQQSVYKINQIKFKNCNKL